MSERISGSEEPFDRKSFTKTLLEQLAELEHKQWSELIQYLIGFAPIRGDLNAKPFWENYDKLSQTPYKELTEKQKESDRKFARKVVDVVLGVVAKVEAERNQKLADFPCLKCYEIRDGKCRETKHYTCAHEDYWKWFEALVCGKGKTTPPKTETKQP